MANSEGVIIQSVARAINILECFSGNEKELGISEISDQMQLSKSTIYGLVNTLVFYGYLEQNNENKKYRLGIKLLQLGNIVHKRLNLIDIAKPYCESLSKKYNAGVHLGALYGGKVIYVDKVDSPDSIIVYSQVGKTAPMHCTGVGKSILAYLPEDFVEGKVLNKELIKYTPNTIVTREELLKELESIRQKGYSQDYEEIEFGLRCIAVPIFNAKGEPIAAISVSSPIGKIAEERIEELVVDLKDSALNISKRLGLS
ncbi:helix-turn-helix domain-containing protein [Clostridium bovifaecis]|uniref:Glycerol operon regulatory protein n=1 Tax=Clostridium bovifaecis TaxID=2184719 RepID=A0A6I6EVH4_9CLOT|nr:helix-turn-helix domain-containing protein [Clostridium bovifaecis]